MTDRHTQKPYPLRMPNDLRERLEREAVVRGRSLHSEILSRLADSFQAPPRSDATHVLRLQAKLAELRQQQAAVSNKMMRSEMQMDRLRYELRTTDEAKAKKELDRAVDAVRDERHSLTMELSKLQVAITESERELMAALTASRS